MCRDQSAQVTRVTTTGLLFEFVCSTHGHTLSPIMLHLSADFANAYTPTQPLLSSDLLIRKMCRSMRGKTRLSSLFTSQMQPLLAVFARYSAAHFCGLSSFADTFSKPRWSSPQSCKTCKDVRDRTRSTSLMLIPKANSYPPSSFPTALHMPAALANLFATPPIKYGRVYKAVNCARLCVVECARLLHRPPQPHPPFVYSRLGCQNGSLATPLQHVHRWISGSTVSCRSGLVGWRVTQR
jgi:hypothetical protein